MALGRERVQSHSLQFEFDPQRREDYCDLPQVLYVLLKRHARAMPENNKHRGPPFAWDRGLGCGLARTYACMWLSQSGSRVGSATSARKRQS